ncbi:MAG: DUF2141 domain-containing protein [Rhodospirillales bacterium]|jgi:uncharacterized protein (DUF2141 family)
MRKFSTPTAALIVFAAVALLTTYRAAAAELTVIVTNLAVQTGNMKAALYDEPKQFPKGKKLEGQKTPARDKEVKFVFKNLTPGKRYAIAVYHDENGNDEFDQAFLGFPLEGFGFSRNAGVLSGAPDFSDCDFEMKGKAMEIRIKLKHSVFD